MKKKEYCPIDNEPLKEKGVFCRNHLRALKALTTTYNAWDEAYEGLSWEEYLEKIVNIKESVGIWALELIQYISDKNISHTDLKKMTESE
jgi:hypothetical protein